MTIELELQIASKAKTIPHPSQFKEWISIVLLDNIDESELTIRLVDEEEMQELNFQYRNQDKPTNVLSFSGDMENEVDTPWLGDIIICAPIVEKEALENDKELIAHWAHLVIHGALHLLGYDHEDPNEAQEMENIETQLMYKLGYPSPYICTTAEAANSSGEENL